MPEVVKEEEEAVVEEVVEESAPASLDGDMVPPEERDPEEAQEIVQGLMDLGMTPQEISDGVDGRVSMRTIYRWAKGESIPQNIPSFKALIELACARGVLQ
jgi:hypothetical protein